MNNFFRLALRALIPCFFSTHFCLAQTFTDIPGPMGTVRSILKGQQGEWYVGSSSKGVFRSNDGGNSWTGVGGNTIMAGRINALLYDGNQQILAATEQGGIKIWNGSAWINLSAGLQNACGITVPVRALAKGPQQQIYAGAHAYFPCFTAGDVYRFDTNGVWVSIAANIPNRNVNALAVHPITGNLYAATQGGVFQFDGQVWAPAGAGLPDTVAHCLRFGPNGDLWAGTNTGIALLPHGEGNWESKSLGLPGIPVLALAIGENLSHLVLSAGFESDQVGPLYGHLFESADGGGHWTELNQHPVSTVIRAIAYMGAQEWLASGWGILKSTDNGAQWQSVNTGFSAKTFNTQGRVAVGVAPQRALFYGSDEGVFRSTDQGQSWMPVVNGITRPIVTLLKADHSGTLFCGVMRYMGDDTPGFGDGKLYYSSDNGVNWQEAVVSKDWRYMEISELPDGRLICAHGFGAQPPSAAILGSSLAISTDHGRHWTDLNVQSGMAFCCTADSMGNLFVAGESTSVYRSSDGGNQFELVAAPGQQGNVGTLEAGPAGVLLMSGGGQRTLFYSSDFGASYTAFTSAVLPDYRGISDAVFDQNGKAYCTTSGQSGSPTLFSIDPPFSADAVLHPVSGLAGSLFKMTWDDCGFLYIYRAGGILRSNSALRAPEPSCLASETITAPEAAFDASLSPNPAGRELQVEIVGAANPLEISIWTAQGTKCWTQAVESSCTVDVSQWKSGVYLLRIMDKNGTVLWKKWVKP